ncbi:IS110 family transposase [Streptomyces sp. NPDC058861]|uniref:IS110 family transposase n=1 Tax=Streptomyces sp. NPDC058861 TaxID=3346653 RepID=UPI0036898051
MLFAGCDWSDQWLDIAVLDRAGVLVAETRIFYAEHSDPVAAYLDFLAPLARRWRSTVTGIEEVNLLFARALRALGMTVVHVDPALAARHRAARGIAKSDRADAQLIAAMVLAGTSRPVVDSSPQGRALRTIAHAHRSAVEDRARAVHRLRAGLVPVWSAAVTAWPSNVGGLAGAQARTVLAAAPGPRAAARLTRTHLARLLAQAGRSRRLEDEAERLHLLFRRPAMLLDPAEEDAESIRIRDLVAEVDHAAHRAEKLKEDLRRCYESHQYYCVVDAVPGIGTILGAYLLAEIGDRPADRFATGRALAAYAGVAPVTWASGTVTRVSLRRSSSTVLRSTLHTAAFCMAMHSPGAQRYYRRRREAGDLHATALRKVGRRLVLCLYHCMTTGRPYDDARAFAYDPAAEDAPTLNRKAPLSAEKIERARAMLAVPHTSVRSVAIALGVSGQTISRHVLGRPRTP